MFALDVVHELHHARPANDAEGPRVKPVHTVKRRMPMRTAARYVEQLHFSRCCVALGLSDAQLAQSLEVTRTVRRNLRTGKQPLTTGDLVLLAQRSKFGAKRLAVAYVRGLLERLEAA